MVTLIELLAVIVILSIIALIATALILNVMNMYMMFNGYTATRGYVKTTVDTNKFNSSASKPATLNFTVKKIIFNIEYDFFI
ncbi:MAG: prepilin-type N-terminal cleavage/methylation domain-containing protein [Mollicutes bacterium]|nr:prepilin-type N-terminal cleavage/methylation domain-containing protein [Mollicutes bacterium]